MTRAAAIQLARTADGPAIIMSLAKRALDESRGDSPAALILLKSWIRTHDVLREAILDTAAARALARAINDRQSKTRGALIRDARRPAIEPPPEEFSRESGMRIAGGLGLLDFRLPLTGKPLGEAKPWEVFDAASYYGTRRIAEAVRERWLLLIYESHPDHACPIPQQRTVGECMKAEDLAKLDAQAELVELAEVEATA